MRFLLSLAVAATLSVVFVIWRAVGARQLVHVLAGVALFAGGMGAAAVVVWALVRLLSLLITRAATTATTLHRRWQRRAQRQAGARAARRLARLRTRADDRGEPHSKTWAGAPASVILATGGSTSLDASRARTDTALLDALDVYLRRGWLPADRARPLLIGADVILRGNRTGVSVEGGGWTQTPTGELRGDREADGPSLRAALSAFLDAAPDTPGAGGPP